MRRSTGFKALIAMVAVATGLAGCSPSTSSSDSDLEMTIMGASSTRVVNDELDNQVEASLEFVNAGSSTLVQQLADGAYADVLITADRQTMDRAVSEGSAADPELVATNSMVMVVPAGNPAGIESIEDLNDEATVVLCDPQIPCGGVSTQLMEANNIEINADSLEHAVADVLGKVTSGEADAGWVYKSDAVAAGDEVEIIEIPHAQEYPNELLAAVTTISENEAEAQEIVDLLAGAEFAEQWRTAGFTPASES
ncbi:molybdate ABC transporter substrate-binding protein [Corynebacterium pilosum]|uniref:Putative molybdate transport system solute-binding protein n=2 Tax=Corynebacterium pilosum TaxID=35756 RepID=A0A376CQ39_9CORY|nr:molybdate ABC transporter substrate-binding protein [Corynebacterium pilosum]STC70209.1 putative molybdate transport system solute-binding protein [Corynebacterium pilosum]